MHIVFLSDNFPPETNAPATRLFEHAQCWVQSGHQVTVITGAPNFPTGKVFTGYRNAWYATEQMQGIRVVRVKTYITANNGFVKRILDYLSFMITGFIAGLWQKNADVIVGSSPQFFVGFAAWALAKIKRKPFIFEIRDLWPASIVTVGAMQPGKIIQSLEKLELFLYRQANRIIVVTQAFKDNLIMRGIDEHKIDVVTNGVKLDQYQPQQKDSLLMQQYGLTAKFVVGYVGTHGMAHALDKVLAAAQLLPEAHFFFVGDGAEKQSMIDYVALHKMTNVTFAPSHPKADMPRIWSLCDVALVPLKDNPVFATVIPSKIFEAMAMAIPILLSAPIGEASDIIKTQQVGLHALPEKPQAIADAARLLMTQTLHAQISARGPDCARFYAREVLAEKALQVFQQAKREFP